MGGNVNFGSTIPSSEIPAGYKQMIGEVLKWTRASRPLQPSFPAGVAQRALEARAVQVMSATVTQRSC